MYFLFTALLGEIKGKNREAQLTSQSRKQRKVITKLLPQIFFFFSYVHLNKELALFLYCPQSPNEQQAKLTKASQNTPDSLLHLRLWASGLLLPNEAFIFWKISSLPYAARHFTFSVPNAFWYVFQTRVNCNIEMHLKVLFLAVD